MNLNDLELTQHLRTVNKLQPQIDALTRDGKDGALFDLLAQMENACRKAQWRLNDLRYRP